MKTDAHMHSSFSYDAEVCPKKMIEVSIQKGLKAICFTDHYDKDDDQWGEGEQIFDVDEYFTAYWGIPGYLHCLLASQIFLFVTEILYISYHLRQMLLSSHYNT